MVKFKKETKRKILTCAAISCMCLALIFIAGSVGGYSEHQMQTGQFLIMFCAGLGFGCGFCAASGQLWDMEMEDYLDDERRS